MATHLILGLELVNGKSIRVNDVWKREGASIPAKVGFIFYRPESTLTYFEEDEDVPVDGAPSAEVVPAEAVAPVTNVGDEDEDEGEADGVEIGHVTPAHYEVWAMPDKGGALEIAGETLCRRFPASAVLYAEEVWPLGRAMEAVKKRLLLKQENEQAADQATPGT